MPIIRASNSGTSLVQHITLILCSAGLVLVSFWLMHHLTMPAQRTHRPAAPDRRNEVQKAIDRFLGI